MISCLNLRELRVYRWANQMDKIDWLRILDEASTNRETLIRNLDGVTSTDRYSIKAVPFTTDIPLTEWNTRFSSASRSLHLQAAGDGIYRFNLNYTTREDGVRVDGSGKLFIYQHPEYPNVYVLLTIEDKDFFDRQVMSLIAAHRPAILLTFVSHERLKSMVSMFKEANSFDEMIVVRASHRVRSTDQRQHQHQFPIQSWPKMELADAFAWVEENNWWFKSLTFEAKKLFGAVKVSITRQGIIQTSGLLTQVFQYLITPVCKVLHDNNVIFGERSRLGRPSYAARPLVVAFPEARFLDEDEVKRFVEAMRLMTTASVSVLHDSAYLQLTVVDYYDGSCIDVWVLGTDQVIIVPQLRGTIAAIKRVINHIFDYYAEGQIGDYKRARHECY